MEFRILGPIEVWSSEQRLHLGWAKERCVLAVLLMNPGRPVTSDVLIDRVWDADAPARARDLLYPHVARLRRSLHALGGAVRLEHRSGAYVLEVDPDSIDYQRFRSLRDQARAIADSGHADEAVRLLTEALRLWRGDPLGGVAGRWAAQRRRGMQEELLEAASMRAKLELEQGEHSRIVPELKDLVERFPGDEKPVELLMLALHRDGRTGEALRVYERARQRLAAELGASPNTELRELHRRILTGDPGLMTPSRTTRPAPPSDLPRDLHTFTGREPELDRLTALAEGSDTAVTVLAIDGMPGVGKSTLAIHLAHRLAPRYPEGQIFIDLCAHDPEREPLGPAFALDRLLRTVGVAADRIPPDLDGRAALWRSELAQRRTMLVLDNALGHDQIRLLLPGAPGCLVLITSRRRLAGLDAARTLSLNVLTPEKAALLLIKSAGLAPDADPDAVRTVVRLCGHLPLAVQLIGNRLRHRKSWTVADLAERLGGEGRLLTEIRAENRELSLAFELSYLGLDSAMRHAFRILSLHPGMDLTAPDAAELLNTDKATAETLLDTLHDHHLIDEPQRGRYRFHDLIREYARQLVASQDAPSVRDDALDRLLGRHISVTADAAHLLFPHRSRSVPEPTGSSFFSQEGEAREWLQANLDNALRLAHHAAETGRHRAVGLLAAALGGYLETQGYWLEAAELHERAVRAWQRLDEGEGAARALADKSRLLLRTGRHEEALHAANEGLEIAYTADATGSVAALFDQLGLIHWQRSEFDVAVGYDERALEIYRSNGNRTGEAEVLNHLSIVLWHLGRYSEAAEKMRLALSLYEETGNHQGQQMMLNNLGDLDLRLGRHASALLFYEEAGAVMEMSRQHRATWLNNIATARLKSGEPDNYLAQYREALSIYREIGDKRGEAACLNNIGRWYSETGRPGEALIHFQKALSISQDISERFEATSALLNIADLHYRAERYGIALDNYGESLTVARSIGDAYQEARALEGTAQVIARTRGQAHADHYYLEALRLYEHLGVPEAGSVRARIIRHDDASGT
ncbi:AfsR/SARP family transcriptional regulator [Actinomadura chokoriensis]|uniref:Tetratricopeptide repeat protein n=1 Tax=Actinomadura chokoriensis TaxID=454156 RepID=A0ABV4QV05_9ACTN